MSVAADHECAEGCSPGSDRTVDESSAVSQAALLYGRQQAAESTPTQEKTRKSVSFVGESSECDFWDTAKLTLLMGAGMFADGYDLMAIDLVLACLRQLHPLDMQAEQEGFAVAMTMVGLFVGQLSFGYVADFAGRLNTSIITATLMISMTLLSASCWNATWFPIAYQLGVCRFFLGLGIGGEYPISAAMATEQTGKGSALSRGQMLVANTILFQVGAIFPSILVLIFMRSGMPMRMIWRATLGAGILPAILALIFRMQAVNQHREAPLRRRHSHTERIWNSIRSRMTLVIATGVSWALFNMVAFGQGSFRSVIRDDMARHHHASAWEVLDRDAWSSLAFGIASVSGGAIGWIMIDKIRRQKLQILAFASMAFCCWSVGASYNLGSRWPTFLFLYGTTSMGSVLGLTTYVIPAEVFPKISRTTACGMAAAMGKLGAALGTAIFPIAERELGLQALMLACGVIALLGVMMTAAFIPEEDSNPNELDGILD